MMIKFIHSADIHLDSPLHRLESYEGAPLEEVRQASRRAFENLVDLALGESVDFLLIAGDLFDGDWKDYNTGLYFVAQMRRLSAADIKAFIVAGNHDAAGRMTRTLPYPDNVHVFAPAHPETRTLDHLKVAIHGQSYAKAAVLDNMALDYPDPLPGYINIGLLHTSLTGRPGHEPYAPCAVDDLVNKGYDYWALGHVHQYEAVAANPPVVFSGCIQGRHINESGTKGCVLVTLTETGCCEITRQGVDVIRWERLAVDLEGIRTIDEVLDRFKTAAQHTIDNHDPLPVIARVEFGGRTDLHARLAAAPEHFKQSVRSAAIAAFGDRAWIETVKVRTRPAGTAAPASGPLRELDLFVDTLTASDSDLLTLGDELAQLIKKLPADYRQGEATLCPEDPGQMRDIVDHARALLVQRLKKESAAS